MLYPQNRYFNTEKQAKAQHILCALIAFFILILPNISIADTNLPNIGGADSSVLSVSKEIELGNILVSEVRRSLSISNDPELSQYIHSLGTRITTGGLNSDFPFTFLLAYDPIINAFALPGGVIVVHSGLMTLAENESEVASVVAHEIAHVSQRHIARNFANAKSFSVVSALTLLAGILAATSGNGELGQAAIVGSQAAQQQRQLAYGRSFEEEADRIGMQLMVSANIDPQGMPAFFERLNQHTQINRGKIPEFLSSHPLTTRRISESKARANQYRGKFASNTINFDYAKARIIAITANPAQKINELKKKAKKAGGLSDTDNYTYAGVLTRAGRFQEALKRLDRISTNIDSKQTIDLAKAQVYISAGQANKAKSILESLNEIYPNNLSVVYYLATALIDLNESDLALRKLDQLKTSQQNPAVDKLKAKAASKANRPWRSHEALGDYYAAHAQYGSAMEQIQLSLRSPGIDANSKARVEAKRNQLRELKKKKENF